jgi:hypothetical protein
MTSQEIKRSSQEIKRSGVQILTRGTAKAVPYTRRTEAVSYTLAYVGRGFSRADDTCIHRPSVSTTRMRVRLTRA